jgi:hypothetical protein
MSLPDELMMRKAHNLAARDAAMHPHAVPQSFDSPEKRPQLPDNWYPAQTGTYFAERMTKPSNKENFSFQGTSSEKDAAYVSPSRMTPTARQEEMDDKVATLTAHALQLYEESEKERVAQRTCRRDVELLKMQQATKRRVELQMKSRQKLVGHGIEAMELDAAQESHGRTLASQTRDENRNEAHRSYIASNFHRMERNQLHRQYCLESTRQRVAYRQGMEEGIGTYFAKAKLKTFRTVGVEGAEATNSRFPTKDVLYERAETIRSQTQQSQEEREATEAARAHMQALDDKLWEECRANKHRKAQRVREVPYSLDSPLLQRQPI